MIKKTFSILATILLTLVICFIVSTSTSKAEELPSDREVTVLKTYTQYVDGVERTVTFKKIVIEGISSLITRVYYKKGNEEETLVVGGVKDVGLDKNGTVWFLSLNDNCVYWWNPDFAPCEKYVMPLYTTTSDGEEKEVDNAVSLVFEGSGTSAVVVGYTTSDGSTHPILTLDEMNEYIKKTFPEEPEPTPTAPSVVEPTPTPAGPSVINPTPTPAGPSLVDPMTLIVNPNVTPTLSTTPKVTNNTFSLKKSAGYSCLYKGNTVVSKLKIKKSVLTWQGNGKTKTFKGVKKAGFIKKSNNLIFMTKKGQVYTLSPNGKKKTILKKGAKKLVFEGGYVTKVKKASGSLNVANK